MAREALNDDQCDIEKINVDVLEKITQEEKNNHLLHKREEADE